jgi:Predicted phosphohydrolases
MNWFRNALLLLLLASAGPGLAQQAAVRVEITGMVFVDQNANGLRDSGEPGLGNAVVSDQSGVVTTGVDGTFRLDRPGGRGIVYVSVPSGYRAVGRFWRAVDSANAGPLLFALAPMPESPDFIFIHASDTHISPASLERTRRLRALADSIAPAFVLITGDLVRDALRVPEAEATGYYELFQREMALFRMPVWTVPGNHEIFGIERHHSLVSPAHPLYGRGMYRHYRGPDYYSFSHGGVHFVGLNTVDADDLWYYGHVDSTQAEWLSRDLAATPAAMPVVTFNHIPFFTSVETVNGYMDTPPAPTAITVRGKTSFRHSVANAGEIIARLKARPYDLALGGHMHVREMLRFQGIPIRFYQGAAVVGPSDGAGLAFPSGVVVYRVSGGKVDDGTFVPLAP